MKDKKGFVIIDGIENIVGIGCEDKGFISTRKEALEELKHLDFLQPENHYSIKEITLKELRRVEA
jgi:hypothetical protein